MSALKKKTSCLLYISQTPSDTKYHKTTKWNGSMHVDVTKETVK